MFCSSLFPPTRSFFFLFSLNWWPPRTMIMMCDVWCLQCRSVMDDVVLEKVPRIQNINDGVVACDTASHECTRVLWYGICYHIQSTVPIFIRCKRRIGNSDRRRKNVENSSRPKGDAHRDLVFIEYFTAGSLWWAVGMMQRAPRRRLRLQYRKRLVWVPIKNRSRTTDHDRWKLRVPRVSMRSQNRWRVCYFILAQIIFNQKMKSMEHPTRINGDKLWQQES